MRKQHSQDRRTPGGRGGSAGHHAPGHHNPGRHDTGRHDTPVERGDPSTVVAPMTRASDADRDAVLSVLGAAMAHGRLDQDEYETRSETALSAKTLGELAALTADLPEAGAHARETRRTERRNSNLKERATQWRSWLGAALIMNGIWAVSSIAEGKLDGYWPLYPLGVWAAVLLAATLRHADSHRPAQAPVSTSTEP